MALTTAAVVGTIGSAAYSARAGSRAAATQGRAAEAATAETARQYDQTRADLAPYRVTGTGALNQLAQLFGLPSTTPEEFQAEQDVLMGDTMLPAGAMSDSPGNKRGSNIFLDGRQIGHVVPGGPSGRFIPEVGVDLSAIRRSRAQQGQSSQQPAGPNMSGFFTSPGYQFRRDEGMRGIERTAAARGGAFSGNALRALTDFNSNIASDEFGKYFNQLAGIAGIGQTSTNQTAAYGADAANSASGNALYAGNARASGIIDGANAFTSGVNNLLTLGAANGAFGRNALAGYGGTGYGSFPWRTPGIGDGMRYG